MQAAAPVTAQARHSAAGEQDAPYLGRIVQASILRHVPMWLTERLRRAGLRPISAVVDITNYVMLELGQPLHAFDNDTLQGDIVVRHAGAGETLKLLDGSEAKLDEGFVLIADEHKALAVAGVMGGFDSRVTDATRNIFLESAHFAPAAIMGRARKLRHTDASHRFERGVDPELPRARTGRAASCAVDCRRQRRAGAGRGRIAPDLLTGRGEAASCTPQARAGNNVADAEVARIFTALGMQVEAHADGWQITAGSRFDIEREEDLIEEVAHLRLRPASPHSRPPAPLRMTIRTRLASNELALREQLAARGYYRSGESVLRGSGAAPLGFH